jgi:hypothetical protein
VTFWSEARYIVNMVRSGPRECQIEIQLHVGRPMDSMKLPDQFERGSTLDQGEHELLIPRQKNYHGV